MVSSNKGGPGRPDRRSRKPGDMIVEFGEKSGRRAAREGTLIECLDGLSARYCTFPESGLVADKAFFDDLADDADQKPTD